MEILKKLKKLLGCSDYKVYYCCYKNEIVLHDINNNTTEFYDESIEEISIISENIVDLLLDKYIFIGEF